MARIRSIHPGIWTDEEFVSLSMPARLFYIGMWNEADDWGIVPWKPTRLKMRLFPADEIDPRALMEELRSARFIVQLKRGPDEYGAIKNFRKFQRPQRPSPPIIPVDREIAEIVGLDNIDEFPAAPTPLREPSMSPPRISPQMEDGGDKMEDGITDPCGSDAGASSPPPIAEQIWKAGVPFLESHGLQSKAARSLLGKWRKGHGDAATLTALISAQTNGVSEPVSWIEGVLKNGGGKPGQYGRSRADQQWDARREGAALSAGYRRGADGVWRAPDGTIMGDPTGSGGITGH